MLEDQIVHTLQQNEDLRVRMDNCQTLIQYVQAGSSAQCGEVSPPAAHINTYSHFTFNTTADQSFFS